MLISILTCFLQTPVVLLYYSKLDQHSFSSKPPFIFAPPKQRSSLVACDWLFLASSHLLLLLPPPLPVAKEDKEEERRRETSHLTEGERKRKKKGRRLAKRKKKGREKERKTFFTPGEWRRLQRWGGSTTTVGEKVSEASSLLLPPISSLRRHDFRLPLCHRLLHRVKRTDNYKFSLRLCMGVNISEILISPLFFWVSGGLLTQKKEHECLLFFAERDHLSRCGKRDEANLTTPSCVCVFSAPYKKGRMITIILQHHHHQRGVQGSLPPPSLSSWPSHIALPSTVLVQLPT